MIIRMVIFCFLYLLNNLNADFKDYAWCMKYIHKDYKYWSYIKAAEKNYSLFYPLDRPKEVKDPDILFFRFVYEGQGSLCFARWAAYHLVLEYERLFSKESNKRLQLSIQFYKSVVTPEHDNDCIPLSVSYKDGCLVYIVKKGNGKDRWRYTESLEEVPNRLYNEVWQKPDPKNVIKLLPNPTKPHLNIWD